MENNNSIKVTDHYFLSANKYYDIHVRVWKPEKEIRGILQISHGMSEYIGRYDEFARFMADNGFLVVGNDHMGHGESINCEDDLGFLSIPIIGMKGYKRERYSASGLLALDVYHVTRVMKKHFPGLPYFLLGHSMGSFIAQRYFIEYGKELDGLILVGTGAKSKSELSAGLSLLEILKKSKGDRHRSEMFSSIAFAGYNDRIENPISENAWLCTDDEVVKAYDEDSKCGFTFTVNGFYSLLSTIKFIQNHENIERAPKDTPILLVSGDADPVGSYGKGVLRVQERYVMHGINDVKVKLYEGKRHEILNETNKLEVYKDILNWIDK